jgi:hypothetical protein
MISNDDLNYTNLQNEDSDDEFRARLFAYKWARENVNKISLRPFTVSKGNEDLDKHWKNYLVLLMGDNGQNKLTKVCFPADIQDNFAIVTNMNNKCENKIQKIREYKILDPTEDKIEPVKQKQVQVHKKVVGKKKMKAMERKKKYNKLIESLGVGKKKKEKKEKKEKHSVNIVKTTKPMKEINIPMKEIIKPTPINKITTNKSVHEDAETHNLRLEESNSKLPKQN